MRRLSLVFVMLPFAGCVAALQLPPLSANHPASPNAEEAPLPVMSPTLALPERAGESSDASERRGSSDEDASTKPRGGHGGGGHAH